MLNDYRDKHKYEHGVIKLLLYNCHEKNLFDTMQTYFGPSYACVTCNKDIQEGIYNSTFLPNLWTISSAFIVLSIIIAILFRIATRHYVQSNVKPKAPFLAASMIVGIGLGGFIDGIILHQILQWHEMLTLKIPPDTVVNKSVNMFWDGIFHFFTWITTILGIYLIWKVCKRAAINKSGYILMSGSLIGWGIFNITEGLINHHILRLHNVIEYSPNVDIWNYGLLFFSVILILSGLILLKKDKT
jgi:uncharacterized membrane protein